MPLDGSLPQREEISWPKMGILKWPLTGYREVLGLMLGDSESEASWSQFFSGLKAVTCVVSNW